MERLEEIWDQLLDAVEPIYYVVSLPVRRFYASMRGTADLKRFLANRDIFETHMDGRIFPSNYVLQTRVLKFTV